MRGHMLTANRLRELLHYDPETGIFKCLVANSNRISVGDEAGNIDNHYGYRLIGIDYRLYRAARLAVLYMTNEWPINKVDHENRNRLDDRWTNLRHCTQSQNLINTGLFAHNSSGFKGVHFHPQSGKWRAKITYNQKGISLGLHSTKEQAAKAYHAKALELFGEFVPKHDDETIPRDHS